jgi:Tol biopolymer transport system component
LTPTQNPDQADTVPFVRYEAITSLVGLEFDPAVSPDGKYLAFVHVSDTDTGSRLMLQDLHTNNLSTISTQQSILSSPVWRPDGKALAYQKILENQYCQVRLITLNDNKTSLLNDELLFECGLANVGSRMDWSPDGSFIIYPNRDKGKQQISLMLFPVSGGQQEQLTVPPQTSVGDYAVRFSKNGKFITFLRYIGSSTGEIWVMDLDSRASKRIVELKSEPPLYVDWLDDKRIVYANNNSSFSVVDVETKKSELLYNTERNAMGTLFTHQGRLLTQVGDYWKTSLIKVNNPLMDNVDSSENVFQSSRNDSLVQANSIKGGPLAVHSSRSGIPQIWFYYPNGTQTQVSNFEETYKARNMEFSNDGKYLIVNVANSVWLFSSDELPRRLTDENMVALEPSWSSDGKYVYFSSGERGRNQILKVDIASTKIEVVDTKLDFFRESADGEYIIFRESPSSPYKLKFKKTNSVYDLPLDSGSNSHPHFALSKNFIYFSESKGDGGSVIQAFDIKNKVIKTTGVKMTHSLKRFTVSNDELFIYYPSSSFGDIDIVELKSN